MALTTVPESTVVESIPVPDTTVPESTNQQLAPTLRRLAGWAAVVAAVAAAGLLGVRVLDSDSPADTAPASFYVEQGSVTALDHLAEQSARIADASRTVVERGSITAIDHAAEQSRHVPEPSQLTAERGSITAIDHAAEQSTPASDTSQQIAERGSITAIDHAAEQSTPASASTAPTP